MRQFDTRDLVVLKKQVKSNRKYGKAQKLVLITKVTYRFIEKATPSSYWI